MTETTENVIIQVRVGRGGVAPVGVWQDYSRCSPAEAIRFLKGHPLNFRAVDWIARDTLTEEDLADRSNTQLARESDRWASGHPK